LDELQVGSGEACGPLRSYEPTVGVDLYDEALRGLLY
jgi:hypothetical protein